MAKRSQPGNPLQVHETAREAAGLDDNDDVQTESQGRKAETKDERLAREQDERTIKKALKQFRSVETAETHYRKNAKDDLKFAAGTWGERSFQWPEGVFEKRKAQRRITITINRQPGFIRQVTNQARRANLRIRVRPVGDKSDPKVAEIIQGVVRNIETASFADRAYNMGSDKQANIGRGFWRILTKFADKKTMKQVIRIVRERNPLSVYVDAASQEADYADAHFGFKVTDLDRSVFEDVTGEKAPTLGQIESFKGTGDETGDWFPNGKIRYVEWFNLENDPKRKKFKLVELSTGECIPDPDARGLKILAKAGITIVPDKERWITPKVMVWRKMTALKVYEKTVWPIERIPWVPVLGDEYEIDGEVDYRGVTRDSKEPARAYNVEASALLEAVGQGIKAPVVGYRGQFGKKGDPLRIAWETAAEVPHTFLEVEPMTIDGKPAPHPQRQTFEVPIDGIVAAIGQTDQDYKSTAGFHEASLAEPGPQESGKAIALRQGQDEAGSSHYLDNLRFAIASTGRMLIDLIRVVYDVAQVVRIKDDTDRERMVMIFSGADQDPRNPDYLETHSGPGPLTVGKQTIQPGQKIPFQLPKGVSEIYDISVGEYDIEVDAGKDPGTRRQEQIEAMTALLKGLPPEIQVKMLDLYLKLIDLPVAQQMAERAKLLNGMGDQEQGDMENFPDEAKQVITQMKQQLEMAKKQLQEAGMKLATKQPELESRERIAAADRAQDVQIERIKMAFEAQIEKVQAEVKLAVAEISTKNKELDLMMEESKLVGVRQDAAAARTHELLSQLLEHRHAAGESAANRAVTREGVKAKAAVAVRGQNTTVRTAATKAAAAPKKPGGKA